MFHTKLHKNWIINEDFENKLEGRGGKSFKTPISYRVKIIRGCMYNLEIIEKWNPCFAACQNLFNSEKHCSVFPRILDIRILFAQNF